MSALDILLGSPPSRAAHTGVRTLVGPGGIHVHLQDDDSRENIIMFSVPHQQELAQGWRHTYPHPDHPDGLAELRLDARDGKVYLIEVLPRERMDRVSFTQALERHAQRFAFAKEWLEEVDEERAGDEFELDGDRA